MQAGACTNSRTSAIFGSDSRREHFCLTRAPFSFCRLNCPIPQHIQSVKSHVAIGALAHFVGEYAFTPVVRRRLSELARTGNVATTDVEPIATHPPMGNVCHRCFRQSCHCQSSSQPLARWSRPSSDDQRFRRSLLTAVRNYVRI
jgi:hypothetical protein